MNAILLPYAASFAARFQIMLQYRTAALAGFATQCWWGGLKVMVLAAFYGQTSRDNPMTLAQVITYTWLAQALFSLQPWSVDPEINAAVRTGGISFDRLRPVDTYYWWFARATAWMTARALPRATLMFLFAAIALPLLGLNEWSLRMPTNGGQAALFVVSLLLMILLSAAFTMLMNVSVVKALNNNGINTLAPAFVILFSGNLLPLGLFPDWTQTLLMLQPFASMLDIPMRIYLGTLKGTAAFAGLALQLFWVFVFVVLGRSWMHRVMMRLEVQGG